MWPRTILVKLALATARLRQPPEAEVEAKYKTSYNDRGGKGGGGEDPHENSKTSNFDEI